MTPDSFDFEAHTVKADASLQKNRKELTIPLAADVAAELKRWIRGRKGLLWPGRWARDHEGSEIVQFDLKAAGIEYRTAEGQFDFHALRHHYATMLVRAGATPAEVQQLLDHCTPALSARYFKHLKTHELARPVKKLPKLK